MAGKNKGIILAVIGFFVFCVCVAVAGGTWYYLTQTPSPSPVGGTTPRTPSGASGTTPGTPSGASGTTPGTPGGTSSGGGSGSASGSGSPISTDGAGTAYTGMGPNCTGFWGPCDGICSPAGVGHGVQFYNTNNSSGTCPYNTGDWRYCSEPLNGGCCDAGRFWDATVSGCSACPPNTYASGQGIRTSCTSCPDGQSTNGVSASTSCSATCTAAQRSVNGTCVDCTNSITADRIWAYGNCNQGLCPTNQVASSDHLSCVCPTNGYTLNSLNQCVKNAGTPGPNWWDNTTCSNSDAEFGLYADKYSYCSNNITDQCC